MSKREELVEAYEAAKKEFGVVREKAVEHANAAYAKFAEAAGFDETVKMHPTLDYTKVQVKRNDDGRFDYDFDIHFERRWRDDGRYVTMNVGTFGSFRTTETDKVNFYKVVGRAAESLPKLEADLLAFDWETYDSLQSKMHTANWELEKFDREAKEAELARQKDILRSKLVPGVKVNCGREYRYMTEDTIKTVEHTTSKNVMFKEDWGRRTKIDQVLNNLVRNEWKLVEDQPTAMKA